MRLVSPEAGAHVCRPVVDLGVVSVFTHLVLQNILRIWADLTEYAYVTYSVVLPDQKSRFQAGFRADSNRAGMLIFRLSRNPVRKLDFLAGGGCVYATVCGSMFGQHVRRRSFEVQGPAVHEVRAWASLGLRKPAAQLEVKRVSCGLQLDLPLPLAAGRARAGAADATTICGTFDENRCTAG